MYANEGEACGGRWGIRYRMMGWGKVCYTTPTHDCDDRFFSVEVLVVLGCCCIDWEFY